MVGSTSEANALVNFYFKRSNMPRDGNGKNTIEAL